MRKGFTIIELLIVVAIVGLLSTLILIRFQATQARSRDTRRVVDVRSLVQILHLYNNRIGEYPFPYSNVVVDGTDGISDDLRSENILKSSVMDPTNSGNYVYLYTSADGKTFQIRYYIETDDIYGTDQGFNYIRP